MYKDKTFLAIIPARGGSKGIPRKNIINVNGKPLIQYTIDEAKKSKYIDKIIVSTEDQEIADVALSCGAEIPFIRTEDLSKDTSKSIDVVLDAIYKLNALGYKYDYVILLQPTQPLRKSFHIDQAVEKIIEYNEDSLLSISEVREHPILMKTIDENGRLQSLLNKSSDVRRQEFEKIYIVNGAIYINKINEKLNKETSLNDNRLAYVMDKKYNLDIDEPEDLSLLKLRLGYLI